MKGFARSSIGNRGNSHERGSSAYSFLGFAIIVVVVLGAVLFFPFSEVMKTQAPDKSSQEAAAALNDKDWDKALELYGKSLKDNPDNTGALLGQSRAYLQKGDVESAKKAVKQALLKDSHNATAFGQRGVIQKLAKDYDKALKDFDQATKIDPKYAWAHAQKADVLMKKGELDKALASTGSALKVKADFPAALRLRARILTKLGKCKEAAADFDKVTEMNPSDAWALQDQAWFLMTCPDETVQDANKAFELAKKAGEMDEGKTGLVFETLAEAYFKQGDPLKAVEQQKKAIEIQKEKCPDGSCLKEMEERLKKYELASRVEERVDLELIPNDCCSQSK
ncbi:tetratricopeptide repeat protein [Thermodesulfobacteriota bacterium]